jgi:hypothetical protein
MLHFVQYICENLVFFSCYLSRPTYINILEFASWPAEPKIFTIWPFTKNVCRPLAYTKRAGKLIAIKHLPMQGTVKPDYICLATDWKPCRIYENWWSQCSKYDVTSRCITEYEDGRSSKILAQIYQNTRRHVICLYSSEELCSVK